MRVLFLTQWFDPEPGALRGLPLAKWLTRRGIDVKVITGFPNYPVGKLYEGYRMRPWQWETMEGIPVLRVPLYPSHDTSGLKRVANYASFALSASTLGAAMIGSADVGFAYTPPTMGLPAWILKKIRSIPFVYHVTDMWPETVVESGMLGNGHTVKLADRLLSSFCNWVYREAAAITVISPGFKRLLVERGVPEEKIRVIYNWTHEDVFRPVPRDPDLEKSLGFKGRFNVVYAGNMGVFQGLETLIKAAVLVRHIPQIQIVMAGTGPVEEQLKALAGRLDATNVIFLNRRQYWEMPQINSLADALVVHLKDLPFFKATIPGKTQVSLASGRPIIMAAYGDAADIISESGAGITCRPEDENELANAIVKLYSMDRSDLDRMGARGRDFYFREMSLDRGGELTINVFQNVLDTARGRRPHGAPARF